MLWKDTLFFKVLLIFTKFDQVCHINNLLTVEFTSNFQNVGNLVLALLFSYWYALYNCRGVVPGCAGCATGVPWHTQILADQLTLFQPGGTDYAYLITTGTPWFSDLPTALLMGQLVWQMNVQTLEISHCLCKSYMVHALLFNMKRLLCS